MRSLNSWIKGEAISKLEEIEKVVEGWKKEELSGDAAMCLIHDTLHPAQIDKDDIQWARDGQEKEPK